jgi:transposase
MRPIREQSTQALTGHLQPHHRLLIVEHLALIANLEQAMIRLSDEIAERLAPDEEILLRLETIPGIKRRLAQIILAEIGPDMRRFPSAAHLARLRWHVLWQPRKRQQTRETARHAKGASGCAQPLSRRRTPPLTVRSGISQPSTSISPSVGFKPLSVQPLKISSPPNR